MQWNTTVHTGTASDDLKEILLSRLVTITNRFAVYVPYGSTVHVCMYVLYDDIQTVVQITIYDLYRIDIFDAQRR